jgi:hypothetical protein
MSAEAHACSTHTLREMILKAAEGMHLDIPMEGQVEETCLTLARSYPELNSGGHIKQVVMAAVRRAMMGKTADKLPLAVLEEAAPKIISQLDLKSKRKMGFST